MPEEVRIEADVEKLKENSTVILGFPDVGLVGPIAVKQVIDQLDMDELGHIDSDGFPPITAVHGARPTYPVRIYGKDNIVVVTTEIPIAPGMIVPFSNSLLDWLGDISPRRVLVIGGLAHQDRSEIESPKVHGIPTVDDMEAMLDDQDLHILQEGFVTGINGVVLRELRRNNLSGIYLLADSYRNYPDPGAAAAVLSALNNLEDLSISVEDLKKEEEEIRLAARDLMRQTQKAMRGAAKDQEEEMPVMYG